MSSDKILIIGATGTVGGPTVDALLKRGASLRGLVRDCERGKRLEAQGVELAKGDLSSVDSLIAALDGIRRVFLLIPGNPYQPDQVALARNFLEAAKKCSLDHVVYQSMWGEEEA